MGSLEAKKQEVVNIKEKLTSAQSIVFAEYSGLTVADVTKLRAELRNANAELKVYKNTLVNIAADEADIDGLEPHLKGPVIWAFGYEDPVSAPKILGEFVKGNKNLVIKGGIIENKIINSDEVDALASLPSREVLLAKVLGAMQSPLVGMANVLQGPIRNCAYALDAIKTAKEEA